MPVIESGNWRLSSREGGKDSLKKNAVGGDADYSFRFFFDEVKKATGTRYAGEIDFYIDGELCSSISVRVLPDELIHGLFDMRTNNVGQYQGWEEQ